MSEVRKPRSFENLCAETDLGHEGQLEVLGEMLSQKPLAEVLEMLV